MEDASIVGRDIVREEKKTFLDCGVYFVSYICKVRISIAIMLTPFEAGDRSGDFDSPG